MVTGQLDAEGREELADFGGNGNTIGAVEPPERGSSSGRAPEFEPPPMSDSSTL